MAPGGPSSLMVHGVASPELVLPHGLPERAENGPPIASDNSSVPAVSSPFFAGSGGPWWGNAESD